LGAKNVSHRRGQSEEVLYFSQKGFQEMVDKSTVTFVTTVRDLFVFFEISLDELAWR
jgi:hypothetical protein